MKNALLIWNASPFAEKIRQQLDQQGFSSVQVLDLHAFEALDTLPEFKLMVILCEISWFPSDNPEISGLYIARQLRFQGIKCPFIFASFQSRIDILNQNHPLVNILKTPCHYFEQLPSIISFEKYLHLSLTDNLLADIQYFCLNPHGQAEELIHHLKNRIESDPFVIWKKYSVELKRIIPLDAHQELDQIGAEILEKIARHPEIAPIKIVSNFKEEIVSLIPQSEQDKDTLKENFDWEVLLIDDDQAILDDFSRRLGARGINIRTAYKGEEAFNLLDQDMQGQLKDKNGRALPRNTIAVVISDLRLLDEEDNWEYYQGYDIIEEIFQRKQNLTAFFILTSKKGGIVRNVRRNRKVHINWFAKEDVTESSNGFNILMERVIEEGDRVSSALYSLPKEGYWNKTWKNKIEYPLSQFYRFHRLSSDYQQNEVRIAEMAEDYIRQAEYVFSSLNAVEVQAEKLELMTGVKHPPDDEATMEKFFHKLIGRRIALGLYLKGWNIHDIAAILRNRHLRESPNNVKNLFNSYLSLPMNLSADIPDRLLVEEKDWIVNYLGISLDPTSKVLYMRLTDILSGLQSSLEKIVSEGRYDDFFEWENISNSSQAKQLLTLAKKLLIKFPQYQPEFRDKLREFQADEKLWATSVRNDIHTEIQRILSIEPG